MKVDLSGKVAMVTGAARGIGLAIADLLAANGARVVYSDVDGDGAALAAQRSPDAGAQARTLDVTDAARVREIVDEIARSAGRLDILVNNAGVNTLKHRVTIDEFPREEWDRILDVDLNGVFNMSQAAAKLMKAQRSGRIINIASIAGLVPLRLQSPFVAAKAAVVNLTRAMALELGPHGILVNAVAPGSTLTDGTKALFYGEDGTFKDSVKQLIAHIPLGRPAQPEEIANAVLFLAAPESSYVHGHILTVDGGWTAGYTREF
ncbi:SDR family NAD(P)-dependent oxidoreductase [Paludisphaera borealis]|uniref:3-oxoacyl-[acyl-carrier-protein] reductase FabG n=1 Tax=Paludisphaera borealis TaxID=1387353 RepID=A0A1U7CQV9_9BACT|nr:SDR family NAD(P)-dependent oxidoreductase [Paludisphaera borealis]APW61263.1 3-oxoacyl-[acyl-carrier-protein] reductase FabG [Paludisphaera borealis]